MNMGKTENFLIFNFISFAIVSCILTIILGLKIGLISSLLMLVIFNIFFIYPRWGLWLFLIYLPFAGTFTYSFDSVYEPVDGYVNYADFSFGLHLIKDCFYFPALASVLVNTSCLTRLRIKYKWGFYAITALLITSIASLFFVNFFLKINYQSGTNLFLIGILGLKLFLGYMPLIICGYYLIRNHQDLLILSRLNSIIVIICCSLCIIQYILLVNGVCEGNINLPEPAASRASLQARCFVGGSLLYRPEWGLIRLPGTFVAPWQWGWFLIANTFLSFGSYLIEPKASWKLIAKISLALVFIATLISGQRVAFLLFFLSFILLFIVNKQYRQKNFLIMISVTILTLTIGNSEIWGESVNSFIERWQYAPPHQFIWKQFQWIISVNPGLLGKGLGTTASAARHLGEIRLVEIFPLKLWYEIGWLGLLVFLITVSIICGITLKVYLSLEKQSYRNLAKSLWLFIVLISYNVWYYPLVVDPVAVYYWFFIGVLLKLPEIEKN